ncbi:MAG TPA: carboxypeptidase-like regulatory domain-containing protein [Candidatus Acidoferrales bacterium]|nr:carboxypeptidase-like regulatory domain-containing protein [Candidatus Acidoferrales bacterium]
MKRLLGRLVVLFLIGFTGFVIRSAAQTASTGALNGRVTDPSGGVVPGATVTVINQATGAQRSATTGSDGTYLIPLLPPGGYQIKVSKNGFETALVENVNISVTETHTTNVSLEIGTVNQTVAVSSQGELLETSGAALGNVTDERMVENLPLVTRNYTQILGLSPGVSADVNDAANLGSGTGTFSAHGQVVSDNNFQMNGLGVNDLFFGGPEVPIPNPDTIQEFKVQTGQYDASFGRDAGANVDVLTKGGGNQFHGTVFEFLRNDDFNANDFFLNQAGQPRGELKQNQFGATVGGPVVKDKLFFFTSYQGTRQRNGLDSSCLGNFLTPTQITSSASSRTAAALGAAFGGQPGALGPPVASDGSNISPQAIALLNTTTSGGGFLVPAPQNPDGSSSVSEACPFSENQFMTNADFHQSERSTWSERFFWADNELGENFTTNAGTGGGNVPGFPTTVDSRFRYFTLSNSYIFTPNLVNQIVIGFGRTVRLSATQQPTVTVPGQSAGPLTLGALGINAPANDSIHPSIAVLGGLAIGGNGQGFNSFENDYSFSDSLSYTNGRHSFHFGGGLSRQEINFENFTFPGLVVFANMPDFLTGYPFLVADLQGLLDRSWRAWNGDAYAQDDIRMNSRLTINLGLRYEREGVIGDALGRSSNYNPDLLNPNPPAGGTLAGVVVASNFNGTLPPGVTRGSNSAAINGDGQNDFAPRVGYAYSLPGTNRLVLRGGYGMYFTRSTGQLFLQLIAVPPFSDFRVVLPAVGTTFASPFAPVPAFPNFAPLAYSPSTALAPQVFSPTYRPSILQEYSTSLQAELLPNLVLEVGYDGVRGTKLAEERAFNQALDATVTPIRGQTTNTLANLGLRTPFEGFSTGATELQTAGALWYNALDVSLNKRFSNGLQFLVAYTWARSLTDANGYSTATGQGANLVGNQNDPKSRYGPDGFVRPQRLVISYLYNLPGPHNEFSLGGRFLAGWGVSGITTIQSGEPLTLTTFDPTNAFGITGGGLNPDPAEIAPGCKASQLVTRGSIQSKLSNYFNQSCFTTPPVITSDGGTAFGNAGPGIVSGPDQVNFDFALMKRTALGSSESRNLEFRAEFFNLFNHTQFGQPDTLQGLPGFGIINNTIVSPRVIQLALKLNF